MKLGKFTAKRIATLAVLTAASLIVFLIENLLPPMFIPGAKPGLANVFSLAALILFTPLDAFLVVAVRTLLGAVFAGNLSAVMYSFTGGVLSLAVSSILLYLVYPKISLLATSVAGAVTHNIVQNLVFWGISGTALSLQFMPYLILIGVVCGLLVGGVLMLVFKKIPLSVFERVVYKKETK